MVDISQEHTAQFAQELAYLRSTLDAAANALALDDLEGLIGDLATLSYEASRVKVNVQTFTAE